MKSWKHIPPAPLAFVPHAPSLGVSACEGDGEAEDIIRAVIDARGTVGEDLLARCVAWIEDQAGQPGGDRSSAGAAGLRWAAFDAKAAREWLATPVPLEDRDQLLQWTGAACHWVRRLADVIDEMEAGQ